MLPVLRVMVVQAVGRLRISTVLAAAAVTAEAQTVLISLTQVVGRAAIILAVKVGGLLSVMLTQVIPVRRAAEEVAPVTA